MSKVPCTILPSKKTKGSAISIKAYQNIHKLPIDDWKSVAKDGPLFLKLAYLNALQQSENKALSLNFYLGYAKNQVVGIAITQNIVVDKTVLEATTLPCDIGDGLKKIISEKFETRIIICGNIFATGSFGFHTISKSWQQPFLTEFVAFLSNSENLTEDQKPSFFLFKDFYPNQISERIWEKHKLKQITIDQVMVMDIAASWKSFDDYRSALRTKFRTRIKKTFEKSSELHIAELDANTMIKYQKEIKTLYHNVLNKADHKLGFLSIASFVAFKKLLPDTFVFKGYFLDKRMVGFTTAFITKDVLETSHIGFNYEINNSHQIYQRMLYDYVQSAIAYQKQKINFGRTAETIKSSVGAVPVAMNLYVRHFNTLSNTMLSPLTKFIQPNEFEMRTPFKKSN